MDDRITNPDVIEGDSEEFEQSLRPASFDDFPGQTRVKEILKIAIEASNRRGDALDHVLLHGPPGLGKTTLANIIARALGSDIKTTSGPILERPIDLGGLLTNLGKRDILFIDEIHRTSPQVEEYLYAAMEDFVIDIMIDQGPRARSVRIPIERFTLVGATTRSGLLTSPMRARFGIVERLDFYGVEELTTIAKRSAKILDIQIDDDGALEIAKRSRGTARVVNRLLRWTRDFAQIKADGVITGEVADRALRMLNVDEKGLDEMDKRILLDIIDKFDGGPVGVNSLAAAVGEEERTIEEVYEPYLIQEGYLKRTSRGREAMERAYRHFGRTWKGDAGQMCLL